MISILRQPDFYVGATENSPFRFEEPTTVCRDVRFDYVVGEKSAKVIVYPSGSPVKFLKLRFEGDYESVQQVYGDQWERSYGDDAPLEWRSVIPHREMPWFCYVKLNNKVVCYGVKTGADCFASFYVDTHGVTLFLDLKCGNQGTNLIEPLTACEVVEMEGAEGEGAYSVARRFAFRMCDSPVLPSQPIFGVNDWYCSYGRNSRKSTAEGADFLMRVCEGVKHSPYVIIDDGWQLNRTYGQGSYIGGPWIPNDRFGNMTETSDDIHKRGAKAGIWFRPLLALGDMPEEAKLDRFSAGGFILDPSHPFTLEQVECDARKITGCGYELLKHDFTSIDVFGSFSGFKIVHNLQRKYHDNTKTTATIIKELYKAIQRGAGEADVIGCNTVSHLTAGIHSVYRVGQDTSGRSFEWTRRNGVNSMMRLPLNEAFYIVDPDCAPFTERVDIDVNLDFLEMCALTGVTTLASIAPNVLNDKQMQRMNGIFRMADANVERYTIKNYDKHASPEVFVSADGKTERKFDWEKIYHGARNVLDWYN